MNRGNFAQYARMDLQVHMANVNDIIYILL